MQNDGTEGNGHYYSGNYNKAPGTFTEHNQMSGREFGLGSDPYWHQNPYYDYFKKVWGNAPFLDQNFRLWSGGYFRNFHVPRKAKAYQQTKALPAFLHYYGRVYDPLVDPPYQSEFDLFNTGGEADAPVAGEASRGSEGKDPLSYSNGIAADCSGTPFQNALGYKRPCGVNEKLAKSWTQKKMMLPLNDVLGRNTWWEGQHVGAGLERGSRYYTFGEAADSPVEDGEKPWVGLDNTWAEGVGDGIPKNMPPPPAEPAEPPEFRIGERKSPAEEAEQTRR